MHTIHQKAETVGLVPSEGLDETNTRIEDGGVDEWFADVGHRDTSIALKETRHILVLFWPGRTGTWQRCGLAVAASAPRSCLPSPQEHAKSPYGRAHGHQRDGTHAPYHHGAHGRQRQHP